ncbi:MAG TPA: HAMP domain-containing sensor histidine kinase [Bacteroidales bacterium]|nr:HAMP domain-containing sensor histidine kinase [Bacteroidales bacterium]
MQIRTRLTLQFLLIGGFIMIMASVAIYYLSADYRRDTFYDRLRNKARMTASLILEDKMISAKRLEELERRTPVKLNNEKIIILDVLDDTVFTTDRKNEIHLRYDVLENARQGREVTYKDGVNDVLTSTYRIDHDQYVVIAAAVDIDGYSYLGRLKIILISVCLFSLILFYFGGRYYSERALKPISDVISRVDEITVTSLNLRVREGNGKDEIGRLAKTFNRTLERLETSFSMQKDFISNASHELRTPLTSINGQLDVLLMKDRTVEEYKTAITSVFEDTKAMIDLANGLLLIARTSAESPVNFKKDIRIDEILWQAREDIMRFNKDRHINISIDESIEDMEQLIVSGDEFLLKTSVINIIDNACKYSPDHTANVLLRRENNLVSILVEDRGIGISEEDKKKIFEPFYRGANAKTYNGTGIGLSLVNRVVKMHNGHIEITSKKGKGTIVSLSFPTSGNA